MSAPPDAGHKACSFSDDRYVLVCMTLKRSRANELRLMRYLPRWIAAYGADQVCGCCSGHCSFTGDQSDEGIRETETF